MLVVPEVETIVLPLRSSIVLRLADFFETKRFAVTKWVMVKATCFSRSRLLVVEPHSRSTVPLAISGMRVDEVTGLSFDLELVELQLFLHGVDDLVTDVHRKADRLLIVVVDRKTGSTIRGSRA